MNHDEKLTEVLPHYVKGGEIGTVETLHGGLINATYLVQTQCGAQLVLQRVNTAVFQQPELVMQNIQRVTAHVARVAPEARALHLLPTCEGGSFILDGDGGLWRAFNYLAGCVGHEQVDSAALAYEAGCAFGTFLTQLSALPAQGLAETIPHFHHTPRRIEALDAALSADPLGRVAEIPQELAVVDRWRAQAGRIEQLREEGLLPTRTTHNDTKISNVLFDAGTGKAVCVIDLDTVMPGTMLYDYGDLVRTSLSRSGESAAVTEVECRMDVFRALTRGYLEAAGATLVPAEREHLVFSVQLITLELAVRFLTDYILGDHYFRVDSPTQNLERARNQLHLLSLLEATEDEMHAIVAELL